MEENQIKKDPEFLSYVYKLTEGRDLYQTLDHSHDAINNLDVINLNRIGFKTYQEGKWTIHKILQHLIDWERIWCFRAVIFARGEGTIPVAHDQEIMGSNSNANQIPLEKLISELLITRQSTVMMFKSFNEHILNTNCIFFEYEMPLSAIGFTIAAHQIHHFNVIEERYFALAE